MEPIKLLKAGDYFGEVALHHRTPRTAKVVTKNKSLLITLSSDTF